MTARKALTEHWPEYLIESLALGIFMFSACFFVSLIEYPASSVHQALADPLLRRALVGLSMGLTAIAIIYSPWGKRSGAHFNPALTLTFYLLGKIKFRDALFYVLAQFTGGILGVLLARLALGDAVVGAPEVNYVVTQPGIYGAKAAFAAETIISFGLMLLVLTSTNHRRLNRYTGLFAGLLVAAYITVEAPISGMSMNPARSLGSAVSAQNWTALWLYFTAPLLGMLLAAEFYRCIKGEESILCCKLHHENVQRCIFRCRYPEKTGQLACLDNGSELIPDRQRQEHPVSIMASAPPSIEADDEILLCPACGVENPKDAVFCGNPSCHKALGEFKYVLEELLANKNWFERLADHVTAFVSKPHFITLHMIWFIIWIVLNSGLIGYFQLFDEYPFDLLSIILAIEAILITGFLLISQNRQAAYSDKRAELDYETNIRTYRKLIELERRLDSFNNTEPGKDLIHDSSANTQNRTPE